MNTEIEALSQFLAVVRGIVQVSGPQLDLAYLHEWAPKLNVADLLERLLAEFQS